MLAKCLSFGLSGLEAYPITIEVDVTHGLPAVVVVGLPDNAVKESKERIRSAIKNSGYKFPLERITINLAPADIKKEGPCFDLPMALGILGASGQIEPALLKKYVFLGELSLDGQVHAVNGIFPIALAISPHKFSGLIVPVSNAAEAAVGGTIPVYPVRTLSEAVHFIHEPSVMVPFQAEKKESSVSSLLYDIDFAEVKGQGHAKRGLEVAAAGGHNVLLIGPPGSGKTMLAKRLPTILPDMNRRESLETTKIHSVAGLLNSRQGLVTNRPFRSPHHTTSSVAVVGGGSIPRPGEVTLAHNGVLFLDELPEFHRDVLEALRQPLEEHTVTVSRAIQSVRFPSRFMLIAAMNPCPCGWFTDSQNICQCHPYKIQRYLSKISGPLLDRIDIHLEVPALKPTEMLLTTETESSVQIKQRTSAARQIQEKRFTQTAIHSNSQMNHRQIKKFCGLSADGKDLLKKAIESLGFSARAYDKILKIARTIADLESSEPILPAHIAEAVQYRSLDRKWWGN